MTIEKESRKYSFSIPIIIPIKVQKNGYYDNSFISQTTANMLCESLPEYSVLESCNKQKMS